MIHLYIKKKDNSRAQFFVCATKPRLRCGGGKEEKLIIKLNYLYFLILHKEILYKNYIMFNQ